MSIYNNYFPQTGSAHAERTVPSSRSVRTVSETGFEVPPVVENPCPLTRKDLKLIYRTIAEQDDRLPEHFTLDKTDLIAYGVLPTE